MTTKLKPTTILLKGDPLFKEAPAKAVLSPGHLLELVLDTGILKVQKHSEAIETVWSAFALENDLIGLGITDPYPIDENVRYVVGRSGDEFLARVATGAPIINPGDFLEPAADGTLKARTTTGGHTTAVQKGSIRFMFIETVAVTNTSGNDVFIKVEVL